jgi:glycosyltransferase involved in cell wall biosynthesis
MPRKDRRSKGVGRGTFVSQRYNSEKVMESSLPAPAPGSIPDVSIVVPARNEEANLGACLESLVTQTGIAFEIIVVDDGSTDRTREIAQSFAGVQIISAEALPDQTWTGKSHAVVAGTKAAWAPWLLFTDADTVHLRGSLKRALEEAERERADLLSYSPEQIVETFAERSVMPVVFAELAVQYPPHKVREQDSRAAAANGQYILVRRSAYDAVGGHAAVAGEILEDVALARLFRNAGYRIYFRYGGDAVRTRMYRNWAQLREGWTKNLALLFPRPGFLASQSVLWWLAAWSTLGVAVYGAANRRFPLMLFAIVWVLLYDRIRRAHFASGNNAIAIMVGTPIFAYLLLRSKRAYTKGEVRWKGRSYHVGGRKSQDAPPNSRLDSQKLRTEN